MNMDHEILDVKISHTKSDQFADSESRTIGKREHKPMFLVINARK
jgi:hypothetical protein